MAERRRDPTNPPESKKTYTREQFTDFYGAAHGGKMWKDAGRLLGEQTGAAAERRADPTNPPGSQKTYTQQQFVDFYGSARGRKMWALAAGGAGGSPRAAESPPPPPAQLHLPLTAGFGTLGATAERKDPDGRHYTKAAWAEKGYTPEQWDAAPKWPVVKPLVRALACGVRVVDHAEMYGPVAGDVAAAALRRPRGFADPVFLVSKLSGLPTGDYDAVRARADALLAKLKVKQVDLLLMHWPGQPKGDPTVPKCLTVDEPDGDDLPPFDEFRAQVKEAWANMLQLRREGVARHVGVSNFYLQHLDALREAAGEGAAQPYANEVFIDAVEQERELVDELQRRGIRVIAYRTQALLPVRPAPAVFSEVAGELGVSVRGLILGWLLKRGVTPLFTSGSEQHAGDNAREAAAAREGLSDAQMERLRQPAYTGPCLERLSFKCRSHGKAVEVTEEAVGQLVAMMACEPAAARAALVAAGGDVEAAMMKLMQ